MSLRLASERLATLLAGIALATATAYGAANAPLVLLGVLAGTVLGLFVLLNAEAVLLGFLMVLPWSELLDWPTETVSIVKLAGLVLVFAYLLRVMQDRESIELPSTMLPAALFVLVGGVSLIAAEGPATEGGLTKWLSYVQFAIFFFVFVQLVRTRPATVRVMRAIVGSAALAALWGLVAFIQGDVDRASGPISDPNDFGYLLAVIFPLAIFLVARDQAWRPVWITSALLLTAGMMATLSRGVLVAFIVLAIWGVAFRKVPASLTVTVAVSAVGVLAIALFLWSPLIDQRVSQKGRIASDNVASRAALWQAGLEMAGDNPVLGVGPGGFGPTSKAYVRDQPVALENPVAHNTYIEILAEGGLPSLIAFGFFLGGSAALVTRAGRLSRQASDIEGVGVATAVQASLLIAAVGALFVSEQTAVPIWLAAGLAAATFRVANDSRGEIEALTGPR